jgi:hypothetical protein
VFGRPEAVHALRRMPRLKHFNRAGELDAWLTGLLDKTARDTVALGGEGETRLVLVVGDVGVVRRGLPGRVCGGRRRGGWSAPNAQGEPPAPVPGHPRRGQMDRIRVR